MSQAAEPTITYMLNSHPPRPGDDHSILGVYYVGFADGFNVVLPHVGKPGTMSAEHLDLAVPEERAIILSTARDLHDRLPAKEH